MPVVPRVPRVLSAPRGTDKHMVTTTDSLGVGQVEERVKGADDWRVEIDSPEYT